jgi:hypothetical protein
MQLVKTTPLWPCRPNHPFVSRRGRSPRHAIVPLEENNCTKENNSLTGSIAADLGSNKERSDWSWFCRRLTLPRITARNAMKGLYSDRGRNPPLCRTKGTVSAKMGFHLED